MQKTYDILFWRGVVGDRISELDINHVYSDNT